MYPLKIASILKSAGLILAFLFVFNLGFTQVANVSSSKFSMNIKGHILKIPYYSNTNLSVSNPNFKQAIVVIHGASQNADDYFNAIKTAAAQASINTEQTLIVAPHFLTEVDLNFHSLDAQHLYWTDGGWKSGSNSRDENSSPRPERIPSYAVLDSLLLHLGDQFPNLESIVLTGHSAGGQVVQRMAATSPIADDLCSNFGISMRFVVANPSSYVYLNSQRRVPGSKTQFAVPLTSCTDFDDWKYGLAAPYTYPRAAGADSIRSWYQRRTVTYLLGSNDNSPTSSSLDNSCEGRLQGAHRYERGEIYFNYLKHYYGSSIEDKQELVAVPNVGHDHLAMYTSPQGRAALFEKTSTSCQAIVSSVAVPKLPEIDIYPNPATDKLSVRITSLPSQHFNLFIFDLQGRLLLKQSIQSEEELNIATLNSGMYFLLIQSDKVNVRRKLVVE
jgi:pimeloyl-ACP methyl ester carboxylesterase